MILAIAANLPVVAAVATTDRSAHLVQCPYCEQTHAHGGHGPGSPFGAVDGGRYSHCRDWGNNPIGDSVRSLQDAGTMPRLYVLKEVPGQARIYARHGRTIHSIRYDHARIAGMSTEIDSFVRHYEAEWLPRRQRAAS